VRYELTCVTHSIGMCDMTHVCVRHDSCRRATRFALVTYRRVTSQMGALSAVLQGGEDP